MNVVIIGSSAAGLSALQSFRKIDIKSKVILISQEGPLPYSRVLLPYVLRGKLPYQALTMNTTAESFDRLGVERIFGCVTSVHPKEQKVLLADDREYHYDKLLIATGSYAVMPPIEGIHDERICNMWTKADVDKLLPLFQNEQRTVVLGSGFVALQAAWAARSRGLQVTVIELADRIMPSVLDEEGAEILSQKIRAEGVELITSAQTQRIVKQEDGSLLFYVKEKEPVLADFAIVGTGVRANTAFLEGSGIQVDRGIPVNQFMQTNIDNIYAAGDVAAGPTAFGKAHVTHALWPTAVEMGKIAGINMAGVTLEYEGSLNMNVTQMYGVTVASMGKFSGPEVEEERFFSQEDGWGYCKICYRDGCLIGGCLVGNGDAAELFGKLRPLIRKRQPVSCDIHKLSQYVNEAVFARKLNEVATR